jgi:hypothetical protein
MIELDLRGLLEPRAELEAGALYGPAPGAPPHDAELPPLLSVAWLDEPPETTLEDVVGEELARTGPAALLIDREAVRLGGVDAVRTFTLHRGPHGQATASEQWRALAGGRRWTVSALTALRDQPDWGPRLAEVAAGLRPR